MMTRSATLEGDVFERRGLLTGGSRRGGGELLKRLPALSQAEDLARHAQKLSEIESQFIVVSLKEGMFNNANVIIRTKFVDGVSTVPRTVPGGRQAPSKNQGPTLEETSQAFDSQTAL